MLHTFVLMVTLLNLSAHNIRRRRLSSNAQSCSDVDYSNYDQDCDELQLLGNWTESHLQTICQDGGNTDKSTTATLCVDSQGNEEWYKSLQLAILNKMYGTSSSARCNHYCMYDPLNVDGDDAVGFKWVGWGSDTNCWRVLTGATHPFCYDKMAIQWEWAKEKAANWCLWSTCVAYGDPHVYSFDGTGLELQRSSGDYLMYYSSTLRIDVRLRPYYSNQGMPWSGVTGVHATAIKVVNGSCDVKFEVYSKYQTENGDIRFLWNDEDIGWADIANRFSTCDEICSDLYEVDTDNDQFTVTFADSVMVSVKNLENMHALFVTVPFENIASDPVLITEEQVCTGFLSELNCDGNQTIFSYYDYDSTLGRYMNCDEIVDSPSSDPVDCDPNITKIAQEVCIDCDAPCLIPSLVESCEYDVCVAQGVQDAWNLANVDEARSEAEKVAEEYCSWTEDEIADKPWLCPFEPPDMCERVGNECHVYVDENKWDNGYFWDFCGTLDMPCRNLSAALEAAKDEASIVVHIQSLNMCSPINLTYSLSSPLLAEGSGRTLKLLGTTTTHTPNYDVSVCGSEITNEPWLTVDGCNYVWNITISNIHADVSGLLHVIGHNCANIDISLNDLTLDWRQGSPLLEVESSDAINLNEIVISMSDGQSTGSSTQLIDVGSVGHWSMINVAWSESIVISTVIDQVSYAYLTGGISSYTSMSISQGSCNGVEDGIDISNMTFLNFSVIHSCGSLVVTDIKTEGSFAISSTKMDDSSAKIKVSNITSTAVTSSLNLSYQSISSVEITSVSLWNGEFIMEEDISTCDAITKRISGLKLYNTDVLVMLQCGTLDLDMQAFGGTMVFEVVEHSMVRLANINISNVEESVDRDLSNISAKPKISVSSDYVTIEESNMKGSVLTIDAAKELWVTKLSATEVELNLSCIGVISMKYTNISGILHMDETPAMVVFNNVFLRYQGYMMIEANEMNITDGQFIGETIDLSYLYLGAKGNAVTHSFTRVLFSGLKMTTNLSSTILFDSVTVEFSNATLRISASSYVIMLDCDITQAALDFTVEGTVSLTRSTINVTIADISVSSGTFAANDLKFIGNEPAKIEVNNSLVMLNDCEFIFPFSVGSGMYIYDIAANIDYGVDISSTNITGYTLSLKTTECAYHTEGGWPDTDEKKIRFDSDTTIIVTYLVEEYECVENEFFCSFQGQLKWTFSACLMYFDFVRPTSEQIATYGSEVQEGGSITNLLYDGGGSTRLHMYNFEIENVTYNLTGVQIYPYSFGSSAGNSGRVVTSNSLVFTGPSFTGKDFTVLKYYRAFSSTSTREIVFRNFSFFYCSNCGIGMKHSFFDPRGLSYVLQNIGFISTDSETIFQYGENFTVTDIRDGTFAGKIANVFKSVMFSNISVFLMDLAMSNEKTQSLTSLRSLSVGTFHLDVSDAEVFIMKDVRFSDGVQTIEAVSTHLTNIEISELTNSISISAKEALNINGLIIEGVYSESLSAFTLTSENYLILSNVIINMTQFTLDLTEHFPDFVGIYNTVISDQSNTTIAIYAVSVMMVDVTVADWFLEIGTTDETSVDSFIFRNVTVKSLTKKMEFSGWSNITFDDVTIVKSGSEESNLLLGISTDAPIVSDTEASIVVNDGNNNAIFIIQKSIIIVNKFDVHLGSDVDLFMMVSSEVTIDSSDSDKDWILETTNVIIQNVSATGIYFDLEDNSDIKFDHCIFGEMVTLKISKRHNAAVIGSLRLVDIIFNKSDIFEVSYADGNVSISNATFPNSQSFKMELRDVQNLLIEHFDWTELQQWGELTISKTSHTLSSYELLNSDFSVWDLSFQISDANVTINSVKMINSKFTNPSFNGGGFVATDVTIYVDALSDDFSFRNLDLLYLMRSEIRAASRIDFSFTDTRMFVMNMTYLEQIDLFVSGLYCETCDYSFKGTNLSDVQLNWNQTGGYFIVENVFWPEIPFSISVPLDVSRANVIIKDSLIDLQSSSMDLSNYKDVQILNSEIYGLALRITQEFCSETKDPSMVISNVILDIAFISRQNCGYCEISGLTNYKGMTMKYDNTTVNILDSDIWFNMDDPNVWLPIEHILGTTWIKFTLTYYQDRDFSLWFNDCEKIIVENTKFQKGMGFMYRFQEEEDSSSVDEVCPTCRTILKDLHLYKFNLLVDVEGGQLEIGPVISNDSHFNYSQLYWF